MIKMFRGAILLSIACFVVFSLLPLSPVRFEVDLPQRGVPQSPAQLAALIGVLTFLLGMSWVAVSWMLRTPQLRARFAAG